MKYKIVCTPSEAAMADAAIDCMESVIPNLTRVTITTRSGDIVKIGSQMERSSGNPPKNMSAPYLKKEK